MKHSEIMVGLMKHGSYASLLQSYEMAEIQLKELCRDYLPRLQLGDKISLEAFLRDDEIYPKLQKMIEMHQQLAGRIETVEQQMNSKLKPSGEQFVGGKKITRAALARRHEKNQEQIRKDQIFVRLTPRSQSCIQFMLCNRNFPRMQCKLSCNQHLEYLVNYLTNKWIRGKVGYKIVLYSDSTFLKSMPLTEKEKVLKEPLNNYLMFTDIMVCCGVHQNGVLNLSYEIVQVKKIMGKGTLATPASEANKIEGAHNGQSFIYPLPLKEKGKSLLSLPDISSSFMQKGKMEEKSDTFGLRLNSGSKANFKDHDEYARDASIFNRNSNFFANNDESLFGSLGFNFGFGVTPSKKDEHHMVAVNSINYLDPQFHEITKHIEEKENKREFEAQREGEHRPLKEEEEQRPLGYGEWIKKEKELIKQTIEHASPPERPREEPGGHDRKLGTLMSFLERIQKEEDGEAEPKQEQSPHNNNSNRVKDVKMVSIVKKRAVN